MKKQLTWLLAFTTYAAVSLFIPATGDDSPQTTRSESTKESPQPEKGHLGVKKILFLGNSITLHGPAPKIGWEGSWGMAASTREKDYVHLLLAKIRKETGAEPDFRVKNIADFERQFDDYDVKEKLEKELTFGADTVVVAIGENVPVLSSDEAKAKYRAAFARLLKKLGEHGSTKLFVRSSFWADPAKDDIMRQTCQEAGGTFVDIGKLGSDPANFARSERQFEHEGVAAHPGDKGMQAIADALWAAIEERASTPRE